MKKLALILAAILALSLLAACSGAKDGAKDTASTAAQTEKRAPALKAVGEVSLAPLAETLKASKLLGENTTYFTKGDEYAEDVLYYTYELEPYRALGADNYLVSEHGSNEAYTCVILLFDDSYKNEYYQEFATRFENYAAELSSTVAPYNPDAAKLCENAEHADIEIKGENATVHAVCFFISSNNAALRTLVESELTKLFTAD